MLGTELSMSLLSLSPQKDLLTEGDREQGRRERGTERDTKAGTEGNEG